jgi:hypothetical protein
MSIVLRLSFGMALIDGILKSGGIATLCPRYPPVYSNMLGNSVVVYNTFKRHVPLGCFVREVLGSRRAQTVHSIKRKNRLKSERRTPERLSCGNRILFVICGSKRLFRQARVRIVN